MKLITRRRWLTEALAVAAMPAALTAMEPGEELIEFADYHEFKPDVHPDNPCVKCYDLRRLRDAVTPNAEFFIFHQTTVPTIASDQWRLEIDGFVEQPARFSMTELAHAAGPVQEIEFTMECAGNLPRPEIMNGQVSHARWSGYNLAKVLNACRPKPEAREVVFFGADQVRDSAGVAHGPHGRSVFVQDALGSDAILATHMNGERLSPQHGFPLRVILPGWYGMAQIKWLSRIEVMDRRYEGPHMSRNYHTLHVLPTNGDVPIVAETSISKTRLKSVVARVTRRRGGTTFLYKISGAAWGGALPIERVELKVDNGAWTQTRMETRRGRHAWLMWSIEITNLRPGRHTLVSRAIDASGAIQPTPGEWSSAIRSARENNAQWERIIEVPA